MLDILAATSEAFGLAEPLQPPEVPFPAPPAHAWIKVLLPSPAGADTPIPVLFPLGMMAHGLSARDRVCLAKCWRFWQLVQRINERAFMRRIVGKPAPKSWHLIMEAVGHDKDNREFLWTYENKWEIQFTPLCWVKFGDDTAEEKWFEKIVN